MYTKKILGEYHSKLFTFDVFIGWHYHTKTIPWAPATEQWTLNLRVTQNPSSSFLMLQQLDGFGIWCHLKWISSLVNYIQSLPTVMVDCIKWYVKKFISRYEPPARNLNPSSPWIFVDMYLFIPHQEFVKMKWCISLNRSLLCNFNFSTLALVIFFLLVDLWKNDFFMLISVPGFEKTYFPVHCKIFETCCRMAYVAYLLPIKRCSAVRSSRSRADPSPSYTLTHLIIMNATTLPA